METRANHVWVGAVTLGLLAVLAAFIIWMVHLGEGTKNSYDVYFRQSVDGLSKGSSVTYAGVPAGQVAQIELWKNDPGYVRVRISIDSKIPILQGTTASIQSGFTGVSAVLLNGGVKGAPAITELGPDGAPVIPTKRSGLGELLMNAPLLLDRLATLTERLTMVLSDQNQASLTHILANTDRLTSGLADSAPEIKNTMAQLQLTLAQATQTLADFQKVAINANAALDPAGPSLAHQLKDTLASAKGAADALQGALNDARPAAQQLSQSTLPAAEAAIRDLRATTKALRDMTERINEKGAGSLLGGTKLPDYKP